MRTVTELRENQKSEKEENCRRLLELVELAAEFSDRYPHNMSGGQRQRVAIARALALEPEVIIMDEATSALDVSVQKTIIELITKLQREKNITIGFICHDIALIEQCAHQIAVMYLEMWWKYFRADSFPKMLCIVYESTDGVCLSISTWIFLNRSRTWKEKRQARWSCRKAARSRVDVPNVWRFAKKKLRKWSALHGSSGRLSSVYKKYAEINKNRRKSKVKENKSNSLIEGNHWESNFILCTASDRGKPDPAVVCDSRCDHCRTVCRKVGLAAIDSINTLFKFPINFMNGLAAGATIIISRYFGAKATEHLHRSIRTAVTIAFVLGIISSFGGVLLAPQLLETDACSGGYLQGYADILHDLFRWSVVSDLYNMAAGILRAFGDSKTSAVCIACEQLHEYF